MRLRGKVDSNQSLIVRELRKREYSVVSLADLGSGVPDLLVAKDGYMLLVEVKDPNQPPSKRKLTPAEDKWRTDWKGVPVLIAHYWEEIDKAFPQT